MTWAIEVTDTFGGEANYCWVRRYSVDVRSDKQATIVRAAKAAAGWSGMRCAVDNYGDSFTVRPIGRHAPLWIMFITWSDGNGDA